MLKLPGNVPCQGVDQVLNFTCMRGVAAVVVIDAVVVVTQAALKARYRVLCPSSLCSLLLRLLLKLPHPYVPRLVTCLTPCC